MRTAGVEIEILLEYMALLEKEKILLKEVEKERKILWKNQKFILLRRLLLKVL